MVCRNRSHPLFARLSGTLSDRWWFALPVFALLLLTPTLLHGQPFLMWDTAQYYHFGVRIASNRSFKSADEFSWRSAGVFQTLPIEQRLQANQGTTTICHRGCGALIH